MKFHWRAASDPAPQRSSPESPVTNLSAQDRLTEAEIFKYAFEFESHPDNLSPALRGGLVAACQGADSEVFIANLKVAPGVKSVIVIPEFEISTEKARAVLPQTYSRKDAVYNIQRSALIDRRADDWQLALWSARR